MAKIGIPHSVARRTDESGRVDRTNRFHYSTAEQIEFWSLDVLWLLCLILM